MMNILSYVTFLESGLLLAPVRISKVVLMKTIAKKWLPEEGRGDEGERGREGKGRGGGGRTEVMSLIYQICYNKTVLSIILGHGDAESYDKRRYRDRCYLERWRGVFLVPLRGLVEGCGQGERLRVWKTDIPSPLIARWVHVCGRDGWLSPNFYPLSF